MPGAVRVACGTSCGSEGREFSDEGSVERWVLVRTLGRELRLRNERRAARTGNGFADGAGLLRAGSRLAAAGTEGRWKLWRIAAEL